MGYTKVITYSNIIEIYEYESNIRHNGRTKRSDNGPTSCESMADNRNDFKRREKQEKTRTKGNARRSVLAFKRLVGANLGEFDKPLFISLTYSENMQSLEQGHKDFNAFARAMRIKFGEDIRYISVPEFQKRGAIHFHTLFWGLPPSVVITERRTRLVAGLWGRGFVDIISTDGNIKIAGYMSKYMSKMFEDIRLMNKKAYIASRNIKRPFIDKNTLLLPYYYGFHGVDLSTATLLQDKTFLTQWLGKGRYRQFNNIQ